ncbi:MAG: hypothetical protein M3T49_04840 [Candidatus Eremiobacteraeota bacterium]|nr:hypothetical protein [Candidatus Eremiobacteraeota bacterium]
MVSVGPMRLSSGNGVGGAASDVKALMVVSWGTAFTRATSLSVAVFTGHRLLSATGIAHAMGAAVVTGEGVGAAVGDAGAVGGGDADG